jgi:PAS domain S-box-containing protein
VEEESGLLDSGFGNTVMGSPNRDETYDVEADHETRSAGNRSGEPTGASNRLAESSSLSQVYLRVLENMTEGISVTDEFGTVLYANPAEEKLFGCEPGGLTGTHVVEQSGYPTDENQHRIEQMFQEARTNGSWTGEWVNQRKDGAQFYSAVRVTTVELDRRLYFVRVQEEDAASQRKMQEVGHHFTAIVESSDDAIISKDLTGIVTSWNKGAERTFGYTAEEMVGKPIAILAAPDRLNEMPSILARIRKGERIEHYETRRRRKDGEIIDISLTVSPILNRFGEIIGASKIARDITEKKQSQEALNKALAEIARREEQFRTLANAIPQLCWMADPDGSVFWHNDRWYKYTGTTFEQTKGWEWQNVHHPAALPEIISHWKESLASGQPFEIVSPIRGADGVFRSFLTRTVPISNGNGKVSRWFSTSTDIDEQKAIEDTLQKTNEALRRANEDLAQFAYVAAHDLQEPLRTVAAFSQMVQRNSRATLDPESDKYLTYVLEGARRMSSLISDLLSYSRVTAESGRTEQQVDLEEIFNSVLATLQERIEKKSASIIHQSLPVVVGDPSQLRQVFQNLLTNALKYHRDGVPPEIDVCVERRGNHWLLSIHDNGQGFKMRHAEHIFGIFKRLHGKAIPGSGIGLAICKAVVERHGGKIWANSERDRGATFYFTLPAEKGSITYAEL